MKVNCSKCKKTIEPQNFNVGKDTAYCVNCENLTSLSSLLVSLPSGKFDATNSVRGVTVSDKGHSWSIESSNRSLMAIFLVPFTLVWAGGSLSGLYGSQLLSGEFELEKSLFGLPFLIGSIVLITITLMSLFGRTVVNNKNGNALVFIGIGSIGWYRRFDWKNIERVTESSGRQHKYLSLEGDERLNFGWGLSSEKLYYLSNFLRAKLKK
jgi:hypothetical protein